MPFSQVEAPNLSDAAAAQIRDLIAADVLRPGDALPGERELAERMGVSRTSIRAALQTLSAEGLLVVRQGSGLRVAEGLGAALADPLARLIESAPEAFRDYLRFRAVLEGAAAAEAAERATPNDLAVIAQAQDDMAAAISAAQLDAAARADADFHMAIVEAGGNVVAIQVARSLVDLLRGGVARSHRLAQETPDSWRAIAAQHEAVLNAIRSRDGPGAAEAMRAHLAFQEQLHARRVDEARRADVASKREAWRDERRR